MFLSDVYFLSRLFFVHPTIFSIKDNSQLRKYYRELLDEFPDKSKCTTSTRNHKISLFMVFITCQVDYLIEVYSWLSMSSFAFSTWQSTTACTISYKYEMPKVTSLVDRDTKWNILTLGTLAARLFKTASTYPRTSWDIHLSSSSGSAGFLAMVSYNNMLVRVDVGSCCCHIWLIVML